MYRADQQFDFCLLIPCYNNLTGLILSLKTVNYDPKKFFIVIVDDGSHVPIAIETIKSDVGILNNINILRNPENLGITAAMNKGLAWIEENARPKYIARLDCGDLCDSSRFYKQVSYMDNHVHTNLVGSWCIFENKKTSFKYHYTTPTSDQQIRKAMHFRNVFIHPTVIFKASSVKETGYYPGNFMYVEDYAFFWKLINVGSVHILGEFLVTCEINNEGISLKNRHHQLRGRSRVVREYGTSFLWKIVGLMKIKVLFVLPKWLILRLKKLVYL